MTVLALNAGSSSLKFRVFGNGHWASAAEAQAATVARGSVKGIGARAVLEIEHGGDRSEVECACSDHVTALDHILEKLCALDVLGDTRQLAVGHRVVHGGTHFSVPILVTPLVLSDLRSLSGLAPLHNGAACDLVQHCFDRFGSEVPSVAVFDTAFHAGLPAHAAYYAIPWELSEKHGIRRFGFHGLAHQWMWERWNDLTVHPLVRARLITLQLGQGCSTAAVLGGRSIDVTMGFTPLEGLMSSTRSGDVDPAVVSFLADVEGVDASTVTSWLNTRSGLLGVSGTSFDLRVLLAAEARGDERAHLAIEMFCHRIRKSIGAMAAVLGGVDAIVFAGGIGENSPEVRARVARGMAWCGVEIDDVRNQAATGADRRISSDASSVGVWVIPAQEEILIARSVLGRLQEHP